MVAWLVCTNRFLKRQAGKQRKFAGTCQVKCYSEKEHAHKPYQRFYMRKHTLPAIGFLLFSLVILLLQACFKDTIVRTYSYKYYLPVYKTTAEVRANIKSNTPQPIKQPG